MFFFCRLDNETALETATKSRYRGYGVDELWGERRQTVQTAAGSSDSDTDEAAPTADADAAEEKGRIMAVVRTLLSNRSIDINAHDKVRVYFKHTALFIVKMTQLFFTVEWRDSAYVGNRGK